MEDFYNGICFNHTGKMEGMVSFSTACTVNPRCLERMKNGDSICSHCFANTMCKRYKNLRDKAERNTKLVTTKLLKMEELPRLNVAYFRLESFGDLNNITQAQNYIRLCKRNPGTQFALWTKNPDILGKAFSTSKEYRKPKNLRCIYSSPCVNVPDVQALERYQWIDKVFTVYTKDYAIDNNININCGYRKCLDCLKCYTKNKVQFINELLK